MINVIENGNHDLTVNTMQTMFLLAREHFKIGQLRSAKDWVFKGRQIATNVNTTEYQIKFNLLEAIHLNSPFSEKTFQESILYFQTEGLWVDVAEYAQVYARLLLEVQKYEQATKYYEIALEARNNIKKMEALK